MKQLQELIDKITNDRCAAMTVHDLNDPNPKTNVLICNATRSKIEGNYGSFKNFFETITQNGVRSVRVFERRSNGGGSYIPFGKPFDLDLASKTESASNFTTSPAQPVAAAQDQPPGLAQPSLNAGLNAMMYYQMDYPRLHGEHSAFKLENQQLKDKIAELKEEILRKDHSAEKEKGTQDFMVKLAGAAPPLLMALGNMGLKFGGQAAPAAGLAGEAEQLRPTQQAVFQTLKQLDDDTLAIFGDVAMRLNDPEFTREFMELLQKHNLIEAA